MRRIHESPYAGEWYPADPVELRELIDRCLGSSAERTELGRERYAGFVVPHASPFYSGSVAAAVYRLISRDQPKHVVVLGFSHTGAHPGLRAPDEDVIRTPLGDIPVVDCEFPRSRQCDHSVEIQLPFLQVVAPEAAVSALYAGRLTASERSEAGARLRNLIERGALIVASSDFTHFGRRFGYMPFPVDDETPQRLRALDRRIIEAAAGIEAIAFLEELTATGATVCGYDPIALLLETLKPLEPVQHMLDYMNSGEITGDWSHSVSYAALGYSVR